MPVILMRVYRSGVAWCTLHHTCPVSPERPERVLPAPARRSQACRYLIVFQKPKYWWVNHKQTHRQELEGEYLWSPKKNRNGAKNVSYDNMIHVMPGDVVFSFADGAILAIGE